MPSLRPLLLVLLAASGASAQEALSPGAFEALAEGHTLRFTLDGAPFGAEQYFPGRRSLWRFADGTCEAGAWWPEGALVCFRYEAGDVPVQCWRFRRAGGGTEAAQVEGGEETGFALTLAGRDTVPLDCRGPAVGS
jgi:hypothetical protein